MSLLNTKTGYTTPWHCSVALMADGEWMSATMGDFKNDPMMEIVYENGRPSYFRERTSEPNEPVDSKKSLRKQQNSRRLSEQSADSPRIDEKVCDRIVVRVKEVESKSNMIDCVPTGILGVQCI